MCCVGASAGTVAYTDKDAFVSLLQPDYYLEEFNSSYAPGNPHAGTPSADYGPVNGYSFTLTTTTGGDRPHGLWSITGAESVNNSLDKLIVIFTGRPVFAVGGNFYGVGFFDEYVESFITLTLSDGTVQNYKNTAIDEFWGFFSTLSIVSLSVDSYASPTDAGATMDNFYVGAPIPEPLTLGSVGLGICSVLSYLRRRVQALA
jgi:hypothetical protein